MGNINKANPVKFFFGLIFNETFDIKQVYSLLEQKFNNKIDIYSPAIDFTFTKYYNKEMGEKLKRQWISFEILLQPDNLADIKIETNNIEDSFATNKNRIVNIDPGYITPANVILASTKDFSHRIYLGKGIYGEVTTIYRKEGFTKLPWTYPDYLCPTSTEFILEARKKLLKKI